MPMESRRSLRPPHKRILKSRADDEHIGCRQMKGENESQEKHETTLAAGTNRTARNQLMHLILYPTVS